MGVSVLSRVVEEELDSDCRGMAAKNQKIADIMKNKVVRVQVSGPAGPVTVSPITAKVPAGPGRISIKLNKLARNFRIKWKTSVDTPAKIEVKAI